MKISGKGRIDMEEEEVIVTDLNYYKRLCERLEFELQEERKYKYVDNDIVSWLALNINNDNNKLKPSPAEIRDMLQNQSAVLYLLIWPIMEQRHFNGFLKINQIDEAAEKLQKYYYNELQEDLDSIVKRFFERYNIANKNKYYKRLQPGVPLRRDYQEILSKKYYVSVQPKDKIKLLLFVIYRYRNNIFHGSKNIQNWAKYDSQIKDCLIGMMKLMDCMKKHDIVIGKEGY